MYNCGIKNCVVSDNRYLWKCEGSCNRFFHGICVGAARNKEELLRTFMLPLCIDCQGQYKDQLDINKLVQQQNELTKNIKAQMEASHALISQLKNMQVFHEAFESMESLILDLKSEMKNIHAATGNSTNRIINQISTLSDALGNEISVSDFHVSNQKIVKSLEENFVKSFAHLEEKMDAIEITTSSKPTCSIFSKEILDELKALSAETTKINIARSTTLVNNISLSEELEHAQHSTTANDEESNTLLRPGWRIIGSKKIWKPDWTAFDTKHRNRRLQERQAEKAARKRKQQRRHRHNIGNNNNYEFNCGNSNNNNNNNNQRIVGSNINKVKTNNITNSIIESNPHSAKYSTLPLDKDLLSAAKLHFSGPPKTDITSKFINFQKGETINPYKANTTPAVSGNESGIFEKEPAPPEQSPSASSNSTTVYKNSDNQFELDPMRPPIVRLTEQSTNGDERFLKARLRDPKILKTVRLYLAYMKDQSPSVCVEGMTATSIRMLLASEGLPTSPDHLQRIFLEVHQEYGLMPAEAVADLQSYRTFLSNERTHRLQQLRESSNKFSNLNFRK